jgi:hypothetical protein
LTGGGREHLLMIKVFEHTPKTSQWTIIPPIELSQLKLFKLRGNLFSMLILDFVGFLLIGILNVLYTINYLYKIKSSPYSIGT